jgi:hypothetical protein
MKRQDLRKAASGAWRQDGTAYLESGGLAVNNVFVSADDGDEAVDFAEAVIVAGFSILEETSS